MLISESYRALNAQQHQLDDSWGREVPTWAVMRAALLPGSILDYGAGKGVLSKIKGRDVRSYDPAIPAISALPEPADIVVCHAVLEHVEPECLENVLDHIRLLAREHVIIKVTTIPSFKRLPDGRNPHLIVEPPNWWMVYFLSRWELSLAERTPDGLRFIGMTAKCA